jgi:hypothetical protein
MFLVDTTGFELTWGAGLPLAAEQTASEFYKHSSSFICEVKKDGFAVDIYLDGEMRYLAWQQDINIYDGGDLIAAGYDTDKKFTDAMEAEELQHINNPWFDLYVRGEHLDCITHDINEALQSAKAFIEDEIQNAKQIEDVLDISA